MPEGRRSVNGAVSFAAVALGLVKVIFSVVDPPGLIVAG
jgi:hypothetical protein